MTRDEMLATRDEWLARKDEIRGRFAETLDDPGFESALGLSFIGAGAGTIIFNIVRGRRNPLGYVIGAGFVLLGMAFLGGAYRARSGRIDAVQDQVRRELASLDPLARAQVLKSVATEQFAPLIGRRPVAD